MVEIKKKKKKKTKNSNTISKNLIIINIKKSFFKKIFPATPPRILKAPTKSF